MSDKDCGGATGVPSDMPANAPVPPPSRALPVLRYDTTTQPEEQAVETWRQLMRLMYSIDPAPRNVAGKAPQGGIAVYRLGSLLVNRTVWRAQHVSRDQRLADATPDHIAFQLCRSGSYYGDISGRTAALLPGTVAVANRRRMLAGNLAADTMGLVMPRHLFVGLDTDALAVRFNASRNRLLAARVDLLYRSLPLTPIEQVPTLEAELTGFVRHLLDPSRAFDVLEGPELDLGQFALAERFILARLSDPDLVPEDIAAGLGISRSVLYRLFAPHGGVRAFILDRRFRTLRHALADPLERRSLAQLARAYGIRSLQHLSHGFRQRYGISPRAWREQRRPAAETGRDAILGAVRVWWSGFTPTGSE